MAERPRIQPEPLVDPRRDNNTMLRPQAQPVETFVRPAAPEQSGLRDVAQALSQVRPSLNRYLDEQITRQQEEDSRRAAIDATVHSAQTWQEAIARGEVSAGASPIYQRVWQETRGKLAGTRVGLDLQREWADPNNPIRGTNDPAQIEAWFNERRQRYLQNQNQDWAAGFIPAFQNTQAQLSQQIVREFTQRVQQDNEDAFGQWMQDRIAQGISGRQSPQQIMQAISEGSIPQRFAGLAGRDINRIMVGALIAAAERTRDTRILDLAGLDRPDIANPGQTVRGPASIPQFAHQLNQARQRIQSAAYTAEARASAAEERQMRREARRVQAEGVEMAFENRGDPNWQPDPAWIARASRFDPDIRVNIQRWRGALNAETGRDDPTAIAAAVQGMYEASRNGENPFDVLNRTLGNGLQNPTTVRNLYSEAGRLINRESVLSSREIMSYEGRLEQLIRDPSTGRFAAREHAAFQNEIWYQMRSELSSWEDQERAAGRTPTVAAATMKAQELYDRYAPFILNWMGRAQTPSRDQIRNVEQPPALPSQQRGTQQPQPARPTQAPQPAPAAPAAPVTAPQAAPTAPQANAAAAAQGEPPLAPPPTRLPADLPPSSDWRVWEGTAPTFLPDNADINALRANPTMWQQFDTLYGPGAARMFMNISPDALNILRATPRFQRPRPNRS